MTARNAPHILAVALALTPTAQPQLLFFVDYVKRQIAGEEAQQAVGECRA